MGDIKTLPALPQKQQWVDPKSKSIEEQVAIKALVDLKIAGHEIPSDLDYAIWWWCRNALKDYCGVLLGYGKKDKTSEVGL